MSRAKFLPLKLQYPIEYGDTLIQELSIRRPKGKQLRRLNLDELDKAPLDLLMNLLADLAGQPSEMIDEMEIEDLMAGVEIITGFLSSMVQNSTGALHS